MKTFTLLVVDDEEGVRNNFLEEFASHENIRVIAAESVEAALDVIKSNFINVAFVDMELRQNVPSGMRVFKVLADERASCKVFLLTQHPAVYRKQLFALLDPLRPQIQGALDKQDFSREWSGVIQEMAKNWLRRPMVVMNTPAVADALALKGVSGEFVDITADEVDFVVSELFGQSYDSGEPSTFDMSRISLDILPGGRSTSVVVRGQPENAAAQKGIWCVIKLSPRRDAEQEYDRYCRFVRFIVSLSYRVELLGFIKGDTVGAMCYSFAGPSPDGVLGLDELLAAESDRAIPVLRSLLGSESRFWYGISGPSDRTLALQFYEAYGLEPVQILESVRKLVETVSGKIPGSRVLDGDLLVAGDRLQSPSAAAGFPIMHSRCKTTVVHGDMNASNVMCSSDGRVILIDYRHTGYGPRSVDFAALECSIRLAFRQEDRDLASVVKDHRVEGVVNGAVWGDRKDDKRDQRIAALPFWARTAVEVGKLTRSNFPDLGVQEYAATCFLWALRVFRVVGLDEAHRLRLLVWMSHLTKVLAAKK